MTEAALTKKMVALINKRAGGWAVKTHGDPRQRRGLPDIVGSYRGVPLGLEVKLPGREGNLTKIQLATLRSMKRGGFRVAMVTRVTQVELLMNRIDRELDS